MRGVRAIKGRRIWIVLLFLVGLAILCYTMHRNYDTYQRSFLGAESSIFYMLEEDDYVRSEELGTVTVKDESVYKGQFTSTLGFKIEKGEYLVTVDYETSGISNQVDVFSSSHGDENNQLGWSMASEILPYDQTSHVFPLVLEEDFYNLEIRTFHQDGYFTVKDVRVVSTESHYSDWYVLFILISAVMIWMCWRYPIWIKEGKAERYALLCLVALLASLPLMKEYLIKGQDILFHLARIDGLYQGLQNGEFPVRINMVQAGGYGYLSPIMYPDLFLYIPATLRLLGVSLELSYKLFLVGLNFGTVFLSYYCFAKVLHSKTAGMWGSILYTLSMYRLLNLYMRAALGESIALTLLPFVLYGMYEILIGDYRKWKRTALAFTILLQAHLFTTQLVVLITFFSVLCFAKRILREPQRLRVLVQAAMLSLLLSLWYLVPFLDYSKLDLVIYDVTSNLHTSSVYLSQLFLLFTGSEMSVQGASADIGNTREMPLGLGLCLIGSAIIFLISLWRRNKKSEDATYYAAGKYGLLIGSISLFMASWLFPWERIQENPLLDQIFYPMQFPFRLLGIVSLGFSLAGAAGIAIIGKKYKEALTYPLFACAVLSCIMLLGGSNQMEVMADKHQVLGTNGTDTLYLYKDTSDDGWIARGNVITNSDNSIVTVSDIRRKGSSLRAYIEVRDWNEGAYLELPLAYYPAYAAFDGKKQALGTAPGDNGVLRIDLPKESGNIHVYFRESMSWLLADLVSVLTLCAVMIWIVRQRLFRRKQKR